MTHSVVEAAATPSRPNRKAPDPAVLRYRRPATDPIPAIVQAITTLRGQGLKVVTPPLFEQSRELAMVQTRRVGPGPSRKVAAKVHFLAGKGDHAHRLAALYGAQKRRFADPLDVLRYCAQGAPYLDFLYSRHKEIEAASLLWRYRGDDHTLCFRLGRADSGPLPFQLMLRLQETRTSTNGDQIQMVLDPLQRKTLQH